MGGTEYRIIPYYTVLYRVMSYYTVLYRVISSSLFVVRCTSEVCGVVFYVVHFGIICPCSVGVCIVFSLHCFFLRFCCLAVVHECSHSHTDTEILHDYFEMTKYSCRSIQTHRTHLSCCRGTCSNDNKKATHSQI